MIPWWGWLLAGYLGMGTWVSWQQGIVAVYELRRADQWPPSPAGWLGFALGSVSSAVAWLPAMVVWLLLRRRHREHDRG